ncbi:MAG: hypothetical protein AB9869_10980 [Verrucomicrobiia bacterium]
MTLVLSLTGVGSSVVINAKVLDKDDNNAVLFDKTFVDTPAADILSDGNDDPAPAYQGSGHFVLMEYEDFEAGGVDIYEVIFDNAVAAAPPVVGNLAPVIGEVQPAEFANFLPASTQVSFKVTDDKPLVDGQISVTLNGETFTSANGLTLAGTGNARTATLGGLDPNANYAAIIQVVDSDGATNGVTLYFDTFLTSNFVIEAEDYNFAGGQFYNNPILIAELTGPVDGAFAGQAGIQDIDFSDTRTAPNNYPYRPDDPVGTKRTLDVPRAKFTAAGGAASEIYDYDIGEIETGEYLNYTRNFPAGSYEVYLRESLFNTIQAETLLEKVTSDPLQPDQTTTTLGSFLGFSSGTKFRNVPLTDALGKKVVVRLSGRETLRLRQVTPDPSDGNIYQNYLIFVPTSETGTQHAAVTSVTPAAGSAYESIAPVVSATIQNRDTTVKTDSILMRVDDQPVTPSIAGTEAGATVSYKLDPLPPANSSHKVAVVFTDNENYTQTNQWDFTLVYKALSAANAIQGTGQERGFKVRVVQAPAGSGLENSLGRAEDQLAPNSKIPAYFSTDVVENVVNFSEMGPDSADGYFEADLLIPGLVIEENGSDDIAMEVLAYLELAAGTHRFGVRCDDGYKIVSGTSLTDNTTAALMFHNGGPADETADFVVPRTGFYPFRMVWYERGGSAHVEWFSVNPATGDRTLINDPNSPNAIKAYASVTAATPEVALESKVLITDAFAVDSTATVDTTAHTVSVPMVGASGFYRLRSTGQSITITGYRVTGTTLTILYTENGR